MRAITVSGYILILFSCVSSQEREMWSDIHLAVALNR